jgi:hypothetical protein
VIEENGGRRHAAPTPNELGKGQEEEEEFQSYVFVAKYVSVQKLKILRHYQLIHPYHSIVIPDSVAVTRQIWFMIYIDGYNAKGLKGHFGKNIFLVILY